MRDKIKKLLLSNNLEDVMIGWELLKAKQIPHNDKRWYEYFDCFTFKHPNYNQERDNFGCKCIVEICPNYITNPFWLNWQEHNIKIKKYRQSSILKIKK